jgi:threonine dehydrogenase-like Zn-dependent dehydrogenase
MTLLDLPRSAPVAAATMRAAVLSAPRTISVMDAPVPRPGRGQIRVRLEGCGVCASNVVPWEGPEWMSFPTPPGGLGHEGWGIVDEIGPGVDGLVVGDRVAMLFINSYAEFDVGDAEAAVKLPASLDGRPFPGEPLGCAMNILRRAEIAPGQTIAIIGIGFLGLLLTRLAAAGGAQVIALSRRRSSLERASDQGAAETVVMDDHAAAVGRVMEITGGTGCERVIEAAGKQWPLDLAGEIVGEGGRLVVAGYHQDGPRQVNMQQWNWKGIDVINAHERDRNVCIRGVKDAVAAVEEGRLDPDALYTHRFPLAKLGAALQATRDHPEGFVKALVMF